MCLAFKMKTFAREMVLFQKLMTYKLCQNANFENGGTTIQVSILHVLSNILSISLLQGYMTRLSISRCKKRSQVILHLEKK